MTESSLARAQRLIYCTEQSHQCGYSWPIPENAKPGFCTCVRVAQAIEGAQTELASEDDLALVREWLDGHALPLSNENLARFAKLVREDERRRLGAGEWNEAAVERAARAYNPVGWSWFDGAEAEHPAKPIFLQREFAQMRAALAAIGSGSGRDAVIAGFKPSRPNQVSRWRHRKRGTSYNVLTSTAGAQCVTGPINEGDHVTVYQGDDGNWWVRKTDEFQDGRFERIDLTEGHALASTEKAAPTPLAPTDDELAALIKPLWLAVKPSREAQAIRSALSCEFDDPRYKQWVSDFIPDYVWSLIDIAAQRGMDARPEAAPPAASDLREREDGSVYVTIPNLPGFHFIVAPNEGLQPLVDALGQFVNLYIAATRAEAESAERKRCVEILHEEGWLGRSEQRIAHPDNT